MNDRSRTTAWVARYGRVLVIVSPPRCWERLSASPSATPMFLSGQRPKPDVGNLINEQAHIPLPASRLDIRICHPAAYSVTEFVD